MGDKANAAALKIAHSKLIQLGWKFSVEDVGTEAGKIINAMNDVIKKERD